LSLSLLPSSLSSLDAAFLILLSGFTSMLTAAVGIGGGLLLLAFMAQIVPLSALIPIHGLVQLGANFNRAYMTREHIHWPVARRFMFGAVIGAVVAAFFVVQLPLDLLKLTVGGFILFLVWGPSPGGLKLSAFGLNAAGAITTFVSAFVGATGPLVASIIRQQGLEKTDIVATFSSCMVLQHLLKVGVFLALGISFWEWWFVVSAMIVSGALGTWLGLKVLNRLSSERFDLLFKAVLTVLAIRLISQVLIP
jgi:uncharacterized membrane protein YfcA